MINALHEDYWIYSFFPLPNSSYILFERKERDDNRVIRANLIENNLSRGLETKKSLTSITKKNM